MAIGVPKYELAHRPEDVREQMELEGYANLAFDLGRGECAELFTQFKSFVALTCEPGGDELKKALAYKANNKGNGAYFLDLRLPGAHNPHEIEAQRAPGTDHKYIFHYGPRTIEKAKQALGGTLPQEMAELLATCDEFYNKGRRTARIGAAALGLENIMFPGDRRDDVHLLRLIDYIATDSKQLGKVHFDRAVTTLAISESSPGLRGTPGDNGYLSPISEEMRTILKSGLRPVDHFEHVAKFFASAGLRRLPEEVREANGLDKVPLFAHDIVNERPGENRQAVVMFFNPHTSYKNYLVPEKEETSIDLV